MKTRNTFLVLLATGLTGATLATLGNVVFPESLRADKLMAAAFSLAIFAFAVRDYSRRPASLLAERPAPLLRPALPVTLDARQQPGLSCDRAACA